MIKDQPEIKALREAVADCAREALNQSLVYGTSGNFSARDPQGGHIAVTPSATPYVKLKADQIPVINLDGDLIRGKLNPTSELHMHLAIYRGREDIHAIVHTHAPYSLVFAAAGKSIPVSLTEAAQTLGQEVAVVPYYKPGSIELAEAVAAALGESYAVLLERHGLVTIGKSISQALEMTMVVEASARTILIAKSAGFDLKYFTSQEVSDLQ